MSRIQLVQDVIRPGSQLFMAVLTLEVFCGQKIPAVYIQHSPHRLVETTRCQSVTKPSAVWQAADQLVGPHPVRHPQTQRGGEEHIRRRWRLMIQHTWLRRVPPHLQIIRQHCPSTLVSEEGTANPLVLVLWKGALPGLRENNLYTQNMLRMNYNK